MDNIEYKNEDNNKKIQIIKDLHQDKILKQNQHLTMSEVLRQQVSIINITIEDAFSLDNEEIEIIFIHGLGSGRLKSELHYLLKEKNLDYAEIKNGAATKVLI